MDGSDRTRCRLPTSSMPQYVPTFVFATKDGVVSGQLVGEQTTDALQQASGQAEVAAGTDAATNGRRQRGRPNGSQRGPFVISADR